MNDLCSLLARRDLVAATAFAFLIVFSLGCATLHEVDRSAAETANVEVVDDFIAAWSNPDEAVAFLAPEAAVRMIEDQPPVIGQKAIGDAFKSFMTPGVTLTVETLATTAHGPVVMNKRIDTMKTAGEPDQVFPVVGVFVVKNGKITEWTDYLDE
jgi:limonene-1,2-epoxide hydrolase